MKKQTKEKSWGLYEEDNGDYTLYEFYSGKTKYISKKYQDKIKQLRKQRRLFNYKINNIEYKIENIIKKLIK